MLHPYHNCCFLYTHYNFMSRYLYHCSDFQDELKHQYSVILHHHQRYQHYNYFSPILTIIFSLFINLVVIITKIILITNVISVVWLYHQRHPHHSFSRLFSKPTRQQTTDYYLQETDSYRQIARPVIVQPYFSQSDDYTNFDKTSATSLRLN